MIPRRTFVAGCSRAALGVPFLTLAGCSRPAPPAPEAAAPSGGKWESLIADLERRIPSLLEQTPTVPALAVALVDDGRLLWRGTFGVTDLATKTPADRDTVFEAGSVSKTVFAYAALKACENGVLDLDTPLTRYTSERVVANDRRLDLITARHVLAHTTGFQNWRSKTEPLAIRFTPGERWDYSGEGYFYLQSVLTHLTGHVDPSACERFADGLRVCATDIDAYMKAHLLLPFGMASSGYLYHQGMARPHDEKGTMLADRKSTPVQAARYASAGNLHTTATDYARFLIEVLDPKPADAYRLSGAMRREMLSAQAKVTDALSWGLGWAIDTPSGGDIVSHSGDNPGFKALTAASLGRKSGFIILTNGDRGFDLITLIVKTELMQRFLPLTIQA